MKYKHILQTYTYMGGREGERQGGKKEREKVKERDGKRQKH